jgi:ABC-type sugar transport system ATPase subunit
MDRPLNTNTRSKPLIEVKDLVKDFPGTRALDHIDFVIHSGEIHALCGENGAGKSVFVKILSGEHRPTQGTILLEGQEYVPSSPADAERRGIVRVAQEPALVPELTVAENTFLGHLPKKPLTGVDWKRLHEEAEKVYARLGISIDTHVKAGGVSVAHQQVVCIAAALVHDAQLLILDEPTSTITEVETQALFRVMRKLRDEGVAVLFITHRLEEVFQIADRVSIFRDGQFMGNMPIGEATRDKVVRLMVGRDVLVQKLVGDGQGQRKILELQRLSLRGQYSDISLSLHCGEILTLAGLTGSGRTPIAQTIFGALTPDSGQIFVDGSAVELRSPRDAIRMGIGLAPEDRKQDAVAQSLSVKANLCVLKLEELSQMGFVRTGEERELAETMVKKLSIHTAGIENAAGNLSGGNQQKVVLGRWLAQEPRILIVDEPTRGIDVGAKAEIHRLLRGLASNGMAILMISSELPEILSVSDRVIVLHEGRITGEYTHEEVTEEKVVANASGVVS